MPRSEIFYLRLLARRAEADVLGARTLKLPDDGRRIRWIARREVEAGLIHYHALVKFPDRLWRGESVPRFDINDRCTLFEHALIRAAHKTPELFKRLVIAQSGEGCDIQVVRATRRHAKYLLKGVQRRSFNDSERVSENLLRDTDLIFLPGSNHRQWRRRDK
jgi:hypothetical protein